MNIRFETTQFHWNFAPRSTAFIELHFKRQSDGIILRLALPMFLLTLLAGTSFWSSIDSRIGDTMTILLAVSALYIVVFGSVPMIGYLTVFDKYVTSLFVMLFLIILIHGLTIRLQDGEKRNKWPLRPFYIRCLEFAGRILIIPITLGLFLHNFPGSFTPAQFALMWTLVAMFIGGVLIRESFALSKVFNAAISELRVKSHEECTSISTFEIWFLNLFFLLKCSLNSDLLIRKLNSDLLASEKKAASSSQNPMTSKLEGVEMTNKEVS